MKSVKLFFKFFRSVFSNSIKQFFTGNKLVAAGIALILGAKLVMMAVGLIATISLGFTVIAYNSDDSLRVMHPKMYQQKHELTTAQTDFEVSPLDTNIKSAAPNTEWKNVDFNISKYSTSLPIVGSQLGDLNIKGTGFIISVNRADTKSICKSASETCDFFLVTNNHLVRGNYPSIYLQDLNLGVQLDENQRTDCSSDDLTLFKIDERIAKQLDLQPFAHLIQDNQGNNKIISIGQSTSPFLDIAIGGGNRKIFKTNNETFHYLNAGEVKDLDCNFPSIHMKNYKGTALFIPVSPLIEPHLKDFISYQHFEVLNPLEKELQRQITGQSPDECQISTPSKYVDFQTKKNPVTGNYYLPMKMAAGLSGSPLLYSNNTSYTTYSVVGIATSYHKTYQVSKVIAAEKVIQCLGGLQQNLTIGNYTQNSNENFIDAGNTDYADAGNDDYANAGSADYADGGNPDYTDGGQGKSGLNNMNTTSQFSVNNSSVKSNSVAFECNLGNGVIKKFWNDRELEYVVRNRSLKCEKVQYLETLSDLKNLENMNMQGCTSRKDKICVKIIVNNKDLMTKIEFYKKSLLGFRNEQLAVSQFELNDILSKPIIKVPSTYGEITADLSGLLYLNIYHLTGQSKSEVINRIAKIKQTMMFSINSNEKEDLIPYIIEF